MTAFDLYIVLEVAGADVMINAWINWGTKRSADFSSKICIREMTMDMIARAGAENPSSLVGQSPYAIESRKEWVQKQRSD